MVLTSLAQATLEWKSIPFHSQAFMNAPRSRDQWLDWALIAGIPRGYFFFEMLGWGMRATQDKDTAISVSSLRLMYHVLIWSSLYAVLQDMASVYTCFFPSFFHLITRVLLWQSVPSYQGKMNSLATVGFTGGSLPTWPTWCFSDIIHIYISWAGQTSKEVFTFMPLILLCLHTCHHCERMSLGHAI